MKFGQHRKTLCNRNVAIHLRLKLFDMVVTPTLLFGLAVLPLSNISLQKIEVLQRKMLRKLVGWVRLKDEPWEDTMRRMKHRVDHALSKYPIKMWKERLAIYLWNFVLRVKAAPATSWMSQSSNWEPNLSEDASSEYVANRRRGRPNLKWDSAIDKFCRMHFNSSWQNVSITVLGNSRDRFVQYFCGELAESISEVTPSVRRNVVAPFVPFFRPSINTWW